MSVVAFIRRCMAAGMDADLALTAAEAFEQEITVAVDVQAERRRTKDRERKRLRNSAESAESAETPTPPSLPPQTPPTRPPTPPDITTRATREREDAAFGRFWTAYPRKVCKADARKAFGRAWRKLPPMEEEPILTGGLERAKAAWTDAQFIPHAATWLNGERWQDEPGEVIQLQPRKAHERPHPDAKFAARQANLAALERGADIAARFHGKP